MGTAGSGNNLYAYCGDDPTDATDPSGEAGEPAATNITATNKLSPVSTYKSGNITIQVGIDASVTENYAPRRSIICPSMTSKPNSLLDLLVPLSMRWTKRKGSLRRAAASGFGLPLLNCTVSLSSCRGIRHRPRIYPG